MDELVDGSFLYPYQEQLDTGVVLVDVESFENTQVPVLMTT